MMRFYEFERGDILIDGKSIKSHEITELRKKTGLVLQDSFMFYGDINTNITDEQIIDAAKFVQADGFIQTIK
ncbi:Putative ABC transporter ATP-binding protein exp8 [Listeria monocytogenes N53-1]|nr:Putative ABC transporter ATP-binding protein exp8 [Listeria monocytogenes]CCQ24264.1 Putative ABC transporter ATP-binding protein exp8 [Listeria monocytogenes N53-1]